jgi:hypothetical protein
MTPIPDYGLAAESATLPCNECGEADTLSNMTYFLNEGIPSWICLKCRKNHRGDRNMPVLVKKKNEGLKCPHVSELNEDMIINMFGGLSGYTKFWFQQLMISAVRKPGCKDVLDNCGRIANLIIASTAHRQTAPDIAELSDEELVQEVSRLVSSHPAIGAALKNQLVENKLITVDVKSKKK